MMNKKLIKRLRQIAAYVIGTDEAGEAADALEVADKRIEHLDKRFGYLEGDWERRNHIIERQAKRIEHLEADNAVHDSEAKLANERIEQLEAEREGLFRAGHECAYHGATQCWEALATDWFLRKKK